MRQSGFIIVTLTVIYLLSNCQPSEKAEKKPVDILAYKWGTPERVMIENGMYHSAKSLDTASNQLVGDTLTPVVVNDTLLILHKLEPIKMELKTVEGVEDFYITETGFRPDTFMYDVKSYMDRFFLILVSPNTSARVYQIKDNVADPGLTNNISFPRFEIEGYAVGDAIERESIQVLAQDQFGSMLTEQAVLKANNRVMLTLKGGRYIEQIQWIEINDALGREIIEKLNSLFTKPPDIEYFIELEGKITQDIINYYYSENEVNVLLSRADEYGDVANTWTLTYTNLIISDMLNNFMDEKAANL